uniref:PIR Superfamily Protein n=1 Tax=Romanomermis culicivorax TaxID=13658 RepID=A0A915KL60_ROMCU
MSKGNKESFCKFRSLNLALMKETNDKINWNYLIELYSYAEEFVKVEKSGLSCFNKQTQYKCFSQDRRLKRTCKLLFALRGNNRYNEAPGIDHFHTYNDERLRHAEMFKNYTGDYSYLK